MFWRTVTVERNGKTGEFEVVSLHVRAPARVRLTADQAKPRAHNLKAVKIQADGAGEYEVVRPIEFKLGETFGVNGAVSTRKELVAAAEKEFRRIQKLRAKEHWDERWPTT